MEGEGPQIAVTVPLFLKKLWKMVNDKDAEDIIGWNSTGDGFVIYDQLQFVTRLLPQYFKHNNMASFIRQLNFYDFHKVAGLDKDEIHFSHNYFVKDLPETLAFIKRKCTSVKSKLADNVKEEELTDLLNDVKEIKTKHVIVDNELKLLKQENAALWSEINNLRVKHSKQTNIINKIIHFLISYMHSHQTSLSKRHGTVARKNIQKNLRAAPTILQIGYHNNFTDLPKEVKQNSYTVTEPEQSGDITYNVNAQDMGEVQPVVESSLDDMLNTVPAVYQISINDSGSGGASGTLRSINTMKDSKANLLDNLRLEEARADTLINLLNEPKENVINNILENPKIDTLGNPLINILDDSKQNLIYNTMVNPRTGMLIDPTLNAVGDPNENLVAKTSENSSAGMLGNPTLNTVDYSKESLGLCTPISQKTPVPFKKPLNYNILENPRENLGFYLDDTQAELLNLQNMLNNLSSSELSDFLNLMESSSESTEPNDLRGSITADPAKGQRATEMANFSKGIQKEDMDNEVAYSNEDINEKTIPNDYAALLMESNCLDGTTNQDNQCESYNFNLENTVPPEVLVDEYFNTEF